MLTAAFGFGAAIISFVGISTNTEKDVAVETLLALAREAAECRSALATDALPPEISGYSFRLERAREEAPAAIENFPLGEDMPDVAAGPPQVFRYDWQEELAAINAGQ
jgi:hypothetical protein